MISFRCFTHPHKLLQDMTPETCFNLFVQSGTEMSNHNVPGGCSSLVMKAWGAYRTQSLDSALWSRYFCSRLMRALKSPDSSYFFPVHLQNSVHLNLIHFVCQFHTSLSSSGGQRVPGNTQVPQLTVLGIVGYFFSRESYCSGILIFGRDMWGLDFRGVWTSYFALIDDKC